MFYLFICTYVSEPIKISLECQTNCHADRQMQGKAARKQMIALTHVTRDFVTVSFYLHDNKLRVHDISDSNCTK